MECGNDRSGEYGLVTHLARQSGRSRPTLYALQARDQTFAPPPVTVALTVVLERQVVTLLVHAHAIQRGDGPGCGSDAAGSARSSGPGMRSMIAKL